MRKHAARLVLALLLVALVVALWLGAHTLGAVKRQANLVETRANELQYYLSSTEIGLDQVTKQFRSGEIRAAIQQRWATGVEVREYPTSVLAVPGRP